MTKITLRLSDIIKKPSCNVLLVDQGLSFGGALIVLFSIAKNLGSAFNPVIISAIKEKVANWFETKNIQVQSCTPGFTYVDHFKAQHHIAHYRQRSLRKLVAYFFLFYGFIKNLPYVAHICFFIHRNDINVVHVNNSIYVVIAAAIMRRPCIWQFHGAITAHPSFLERLFKKNVKQYIAISNYVSKSAVQFGYPARKITTLHNPVNDNFIYSTKNDDEIRYKIRLSLGLKKSQLLFAIFGRVIRWKGQLELVQAFAKIHEKLDAKLVIVGDTTEGFDNDYINDIKAFTEVAGLDDKVIFYGFTKDVRSMYLAADIVVHASIEPEPFGLVIIEAMSMGKPIIASNLGAPNELITHGTDGLIVSPFDTESLGQCMLRLALNKKLQTRFIKNGLHKVKTGFLPKDYARQLGTIYQLFSKSRTKA